MGDSDEQTSDNANPPGDETIELTKAWRKLRKETVRSSMKPGGCAKSREASPHSRRRTENIVSETEVVDLTAVNSPSLPAVRRPRSTIIPKRKRHDDFQSASYMYRENLP